MIKTAINHKKTNYKAKPFLKWAGGKGQLLNTFQKFYPEELQSNKIKNYFEPFIGGGAVFFDIAQRFEIESAYLYDVNEELILAYKVIQKDVFKLMDFLSIFQKKYDKLDTENRTKLFYEIRQEFNTERFNIDYKKYSDNWIYRTAQIIFLNKTCFNGLFRFNLKGGFNTPVGRYKNPKILDEGNLQKVSELLQIAVVKNADFKLVKQDLKENSFVYFDPPYRPISKTSSFTAYSKNGFGDIQQTELANTFELLNSKGAQLMLSNSDPKNTDPADNFFDDLYIKHHIYRVAAKRMINSNAAKRAAINEIVVTNYPVKYIG